MGCLMAVARGSALTLFSRRPITRAMPSWWSLAWPGMCATITGVGFARFSYTAIIPFLVGAGEVTAPEADYLGAANLAGYFMGALIAHRIREGWTRGYRLFFGQTQNPVSAHNMEDLGWRPRFTLAQARDDFLAWMDEHHES